MELEFMELEFHLKCRYRVCLNISIGMGRSNLKIFFKKNCMEFEFMELELYLKCHYRVYLNVTIDMG